MLYLFAPAVCSDTNNKLELFEPVLLSNMLQDE